MPYHGSDAATIFLVKRSPPVLGTTRALQSGMDCQTVNETITLKQSWVKRNVSRVHMNWPILKNPHVSNDFLLFKNRIKVSDSETLPPETNPLILSLSPSCLPSISPPHPTPGLWVKHACSSATLPMHSPGSTSPQCK